MTLVPCIYRVLIHVDLGNGAIAPEPKQLIRESQCSETLAAAQIPVLFGEAIVSFPQAHWDDGEQLLVLTSTLKLPIGQSAKIVDQLLIAGFEDKTPQNEASPPNKVIAT